jgi:hypothetical protein
MPTDLPLPSPQRKKQALLAELDCFIIWPDVKKRPRFSLREWHRLVGWMNLSFNVFPLLRPALNNLYAKTAGLTDWDHQMTMTWSVSNDLKWAREYINVSNGVHIIQE